MRLLEVSWGLSLPFKLFTLVTFVTEVKAPLNGWEAPLHPDLYMLCVHMCMYTRGHRACSVHTPNSVPAPKPHDGTMFTLPSGLEFRCCFKDPRVVHTVLLSPSTTVSTQRAWISHIGVTLHLKRRNSVNPPTWWILLITHCMTPVQYQLHALTAHALHKLSTVWTCVNAGHTASVWMCHDGVWQ